MRNENEVERLVELAARAIVARIGAGVTVADARPFARREIERRIERGLDVERFIREPGGAAVVECNMIAKRRQAKRTARQVEQHAEKLAALSQSFGVIEQELRAIGCGMHTLRAYQQQQR